MRPIDAIRHIKKRWGGYSVDGTKYFSPFKTIDGVVSQLNSFDLTANNCGMIFFLTSRPNPDDPHGRIFSVERLSIEFYKEEKWV